MVFPSCWYDKSMKQPLHMQKHLMWWWTCTWVLTSATHL